MIFTERDAARLATEAMFDRMEAKEQRIRFSTLAEDACFEADLGAYKAIRCPIGVQLPPLTVEAAKARISAIREIADEWQYSQEGLNPGLFEAELSRLEAFIAHNP